jgi:excisionase family DNA binding protein
LEQISYPWAQQQADQGRLLTVPTDKLAYRIDEAVHVSGLSRTTLYKLIAGNKLESAKVEGRRLILRADLVAYLESRKGQPS